MDFESNSDDAATGFFAGFADDPIRTAERETRNRRSPLLRNAKKRMDKMGVLNYLTEKDWQEIESHIKKCVKEVLLESVEIEVEMQQKTGKKADA